MKQETIQQSRKQLEEAFSSLGSDKKSNKHTLYVIIFAAVMLLLGLIIGGVVGYDMAEPDSTPTQQDSIAINLKNQITSIDSAGQVSVVINDTAHTYLVVRQDSIKK